VSAYTVGGYGRIDPATSNEYETRSVLPTRNFNDMAWRRCRGASHGRQVKRQVKPGCVARPFAVAEGGTRVRAANSMPLHTRHSGLDSSSNARCSPISRGYFFFLPASFAGAASASPPPLLHAGTVPWYQARSA